MILSYVSLLSIFLVGTASAAQTMGWFYDAAKGDVACTANATYHAHDITFLKPGFISVSNAGVLSFDTSAGGACNAGDPATIADIKKHSKYQFATVGSADNGVDAVNALVSSASKSSAAITQLVNFAVSSGFTGIEIDLEGYEDWTATTFNNYKTFVTNLGNALHAKGKQLMIDTPAIYNQDQQDYYKNFKFEGLNGLPIDYVCVMAYEDQFDGSCGHPVASNSFVTGTIKWTFDKFQDHNKVVIGMPSYGYHCPTGSTDPSNWSPDEPQSKSKTYPGYNTATRDPDSFEMKWTNGGKTYLYCDETTMDKKRALIESLGVQYVSVWYLGGNPWFST